MHRGRHFIRSISGHMAGVTMATAAAAGHAVSSPPPVPVPLATTSHTASARTYRAESSITSTALVFIIFMWVAL